MNIFLIEIQQNQFQIIFYSFQVLSQNLTSSVLGKRRFGLLVPIVYYQLKDAKSQKPSRRVNFMELSNKHKIHQTNSLLYASHGIIAIKLEIHLFACREEMKSVHALAWAVELLRASQLVTADTIGINDTRCHVNHKHTLSQTPKTPVTSGGDPTWAEKHELGSRL